MRGVIVAVLMLATGAVRADQCAVVSREQAQSAVRQLPKGTLFVTYCEPCGDKKPSVPDMVSISESKPWQTPPQYEVVVNGKSVDLAYLYVQKAAGDTHYVNAASLGGCQTQGVTKEIEASPKYQLLAHVKDIGLGHKLPAKPSGPSGPSGP